MGSNIRSVMASHVDAAIAQIGNTSWYSTLHRARFVAILSLLFKIKGTDKPKVLELGVWPGYLALSMALSGYQVEGIDRDATRIKNIPQLKPITTFDLLTLEKAPLPYQDEYFDIIVASEVIEHLPPAALPGLLNELRRIVKIEGTILLTTPNQSSLSNILQPKKTSHIVECGHGHYKEYGSAELKKLLEGAKLAVREIKPTNFYSLVGKQRNGEYYYPLSNFFRHTNRWYNFLKILTLPFKAIPGLRDSWIIVATRADELNRSLSS